VNEDKATRYHRLKRRAAVVSFAWTAGLFAALIWTGWSAVLRSAAERLASGPALLVVLYTAALTLLHEAGGLAIAFYGGFLLERRYGLSNESFKGWLTDQAKSLALGLPLAIGAVSLIYALVRWFPAGWWLPAGAIFALVIIGLANLAPVLLLPLFYRVKPLERQALRARLIALADRAGARVLGAYEWGLGEKTRKANAALAGLGSTRRILVSDTMLSEYTDEEIEIILAHELAHHVHGDIWKMIAFDSALVVGGFFLAAQVMDAATTAFGLRGPADPAGLPILLLAAGAVSLLMLPAAHAMSRAYERRADRFALELTRNPTAFVTAMRRLAAQNLAEDQPSRAIQWLFYSHPPIRERIAAAQAFKV
jgi:STE24 endopeptidase